MSCQTDWFVSQMSATVYPKPSMFKGHSFPLLFKQQDIHSHATYCKKMPRLHHLSENSQGTVVFLSFTLFMVWPLSRWLQFLSWFCDTSPHLSVQNDTKIRLLQEAQCKRRIKVHLNIGNGLMLILIFTDLNTYPRIFTIIFSLTVSR